MGRPKTIRLAPSSRASRGVLERAWSSSLLPLGLTPGVTTSPFSPQTNLSLFASWGLQTTPARPAFFAKVERLRTAPSTPLCQPTARTASSLRLVRRVTPRTWVSLAAWETAAAIISSPPEAWTVKKRGFQGATARTACPTVLGMSWNLRSRKMGTSSFCSPDKTSTPERKYSCSPILKVPILPRNRLAQLKASSDVSTSRARMIWSGFNPPIES